MMKVWNYHIAVVVDIDFKIDNASMKEETLIEKGFLIKCGSMMISTSVYGWSQPQQI